MKIFESFKDKYFNRLNEVGMDLGDLDFGEEKPKDKEPEDPYGDVPRLDKEAYILAKTDKEEKDLTKLTDEEISTMYLNLK